jgi:hypothetical protein
LDLFHCSLQFLTLGKRGTFSTFVRRESSLTCEGYRNGAVGLEGEPAQSESKGSGCFLWVQEEQIDWEDKLMTTPMKKLLSLAVIAIVAFVAGCNKPADTGAAAGGTNAPAKTP